MAASADGLNAKQQQFVLEYIVDFNATQAALRAGYSAKTAARIGSENLQKPDIQLAVTRAINARQKRTEITEDYVLSTIRDTVERCRQAEPVTDREGNPTGEYRFDAAATLKGCELLGKHLKMWTDKTEHSGEVKLSLADQIRRGHQQRQAQQDKPHGD